MNGLEETIGTNGFSMVFGLTTIGPDVFLVWQPLGSMVLRWFLVWQTIGSDGFSMVLVWPTIGTNGFSMVFPIETMVFQWFWVWQTIGTNGFSMVFSLETMVFQWFPMVANHWSNDGMVTIHRRGLSARFFDNYNPPFSASSFSSTSLY